jgi:hypothetical protein
VGGQGLLAGLLGLGRSLLGQAQLAAAVGWARGAQRGEAVALGA